jgi:hypothetical protein
MQSVNLLAQAALMRAARRVSYAATAHPTTGAHYRDKVVPLRKRFR